MSWGSEVMMLGQVGIGRSSGALAGLGQTPSMPAAPADWAFLLGSYTGAWVGGAGVGYIVGKRGPDAITGGLAASGIWGLGETVASARDRNPWLSLLFLGLGAGSLYFAWQRSGRRG